MGDIRSGLANIAAHLPHHANVLIAVEERVLLLPTVATVRRTIRFQAGVGQDDD